MTRVQATVRDWSQEGGSAFLDDGSVLGLPADVLRDGPFRLLRAGQRVALTIEEGRVRRVELP
jgi:hypothetical protein